MRLLTFSEISRENFQFSNQNFFRVNAFIPGNVNNQLDLVPINSKNFEMTQGLSEKHFDLGTSDIQGEQRTRENLTPECPQTKGFSNLPKNAQNSGEKAKKLGPPLKMDQIVDSPLSDFKIRDTGTRPKNSNVKKVKSPKIDKQSQVEVKDYVTRSGRRQKKNVRFLNSEVKNHQFKEYSLQELTYGLINSHMPGDISMKEMSLWLFYNKVDQK